MTSLKEWMDAQWQKPGVRCANHGVAYIDADWNGDDTSTIRAAIARLEMLQSYGETHDVDH